MDQELVKCCPFVVGIKESVKYCGEWCALFSENRYCAFFNIGRVLEDIAFALDVLSSMRR